MKGNVANREGKFAYITYVFTFDLAGINQPYVIKIEHCRIKIIKRREVFVRTPDIEYLTLCGEIFKQDERVYTFVEAIFAQGNRDLINFIAVSGSVNNSIALIQVQIQQEDPVYT